MALGDQYEQYYADGEYYENGEVPRRKTPEQIANSIDWHIQLILIFAIIFIMLGWIWLYCCLFPIIECCGYWKDKKTNRDPKYRIVKRVGKQTKVKPPTYDEYVIIKEAYDKVTPEEKEFDPEAFLRFYTKSKQAAPTDQ